MTNTTNDVLELLADLYEHFDNTADIDSDGSPNESLRFCHELEMARKAIVRMTRTALDAAHFMDGLAADELDGAGHVTYESTRASLRRQFKEPQ
jgi:hypothetical protein